ncbi:MAG: diguanylate cyclase [Phycisphaerales bacterium]
MQTNETKPKVLLIDDSAFVHKLLAARLKYEHLELLCASSGAEGLEAARAQHPSAILLDLEMPDLDGFGVLRELKGDPATATIPVVILSGTSDSDAKVTAFDLGATDYVSKALDLPGDVAELRARLRSVLRLERLLRLLAERAEIDGLTGLGNRTQFDRRLAQSLAENQRHGHALSLALIDCDHFKKVNDTFGHPAGDEVLVGLGRLIQASCRGTDVPCRYGGEEFALLMPNTGPDDAEVVCERIRCAMAKQTWPRHPDRNVTVSVGVAGVAGASALTSMQLVERADDALYQAKRGGRNRVVRARLEQPMARTV